MRKHYFNCTRVINGNITVDTWHGTADAMSRVAKSYDFIIPLDRKPRNVKEIKEA